MASWSHLFGLVWYMAKLFTLLGTLPTAVEPTLTTWIACWLDGAPPSC